MDWLSTALAIVTKRKPLIPFLMLYISCLIWLDTGGLLTFLQNIFNNEIRIRSLFWYFAPWLAAWLIWALDAILGTGTRLNAMCSDLETILCRISQLELELENDRWNGYEQLVVEICKVRQSLRKLNVPTLDVVYHQKEHRARVGLRAWRKFVINLIVAAIESDYPKAQKMLRDSKLLQALKFDQEEAELIPPITPQNFVAKVETEKITLTWDTVSAPVTGYRI